MKVALVLGHKPSSQGARNYNGTTEYNYNSKLINEVRRSIQPYIDVVIVERDTYRDLPNKINSHSPDLIISFHCNAFNTDASGTEVLYYHKSKTSAKHAKNLLIHLVDALGLPNRGIKPKTSEERGGYLLRYTHAPCIIAEPFFIDNLKDLNTAIVREEQLIAAYKEFIFTAAIPVGTT